MLRLRLIHVVSVVAPTFAAVLGGCPDNDSAPDPSPDAAATSDAAPTDGSPPDGAADAPVDDPIERVITLVLSSPDLPPQFVCLGGFRADERGEPTGDPVIAGGPFGIPDPSDPAKRKLTSGFPYGAVVKLPVRLHDAKFFDQFAAIGYVVDDVSPREFAGSGNDSETCKRAWPSARSVPGRKLVFKRGELHVGEAWVAGATGCEGPSTAPECGGGSNLQMASARLDLGTPSAYAGAGDLSLGIQVANFSAFSGFQSLDFYLQPVHVEGGAKVPDGAPIALAGGAAGLSRGRVAGATAGVHVASADTAETLLLASPHGSTPCVSGDGCKSVAVPVEPFRAGYAAPSGGATGAAWSGHQVFALFGKIPTATGETPASVLHLGIFEAELPTANP